MNPEFQTALHAVTEIMERENTALQAMDLRAAAALTADKSHAVATLAALRPGPMARAALARLETLTQVNRALLERGLAAQSRVIGLIATAAQSARRAQPGHGSRYNGHGRPASTGGQGIAISTRI